MLDSYEQLPVMYKACLLNGQLVVTSISAHVYRRIGTMGLGASKQEAIEILKKKTMDDFANTMQRISWQAQQFI